MAYETKVLLIAIGEIMRKSENLEDAYAALAKIANVEGVLLGPFHQESSEATK